MVSDASYSSQTKCAGLGVIDLYTNKEYSRTLQEVANSYHAEYRALLLSVTIALRNNYNNVVFVYDNKNLNLKSLKVWLHGKIDSFQFLWLKRNYVKNADKIARTARELQEQLCIDKPKQSPSLGVKKKKIPNLNDQQLIEAIRCYKPEKIAKFCLTIASDEEKELVNNYLNKKKSTKYTPTKNGIDVLMLLCFLLPKEIRKNFFLYVKNKVKDKKYQLKVNRNKPIAFYVKRIHKIIDKRRSQY